MGKKHRQPCPKCKTQMRPTGDARRQQMPAPAESDQGYVFVPAGPWIRPFKCPECGKKAELEVVGP